MMFLCRLGMRVGLLAGILAVAACAESSPAVEDSDLIVGAYDSADRLYESLRSLPYFDKIQGTAILYTSLANITHLDQSSRFGQMLVEHIASRLSKNNLKIAEVRLRTAFSVTPSGEFMLSRDVRKIDQRQRVAFVLVGTYAAGVNVVLVNLKVLDVNNGEVIATDDFSVPMGPNTKSFLDGPLADNLGGTTEMAGAYDTRDLSDHARAYCATRKLEVVLRDVKYEGGIATSAFSCVPPNKP